MRFDRFRMRFGMRFDRFGMRFVFRFDRFGMRFVLGFALRFVLRFVEPERTLQIFLGSPNSEPGGSGSANPVT